MNILIVKQHDRDKVGYEVQLNGVSVPMLESVQVVSKWGEPARVIITCVVEKSQDAGVIVESLNK